MTRKDMEEQFEDEFSIYTDKQYFKETAGHFFRKGWERAKSAAANCSSAGQGDGDAGLKKEVGGLAAEYLEEMHVSGDVMVERDHNMDGEESGSYYVHDLMSGFVKHLNNAWGDF